MKFLLGLLLHMDVSLTWKALFPTFGVFFCSRSLVYPNIKSVKKILIRTFQGLFEKQVFLYDDNVTLR